MLAASAGTAGAEATTVGMLFTELGAIVIALATLARIASWVRLSPIPLYLLAGLAFGEGGLFPLSLSEDFVEVGAEIGVLLLLFMLGLEYSAAELRSSLRASWPSGVLDWALNFTPGLVAGFLLGWEPVAAVLLGGVTYISSSGVIAKVLSDLDRLGYRETPAVLSILVMEDLAMAAYLPAVVVFLAATDVMSAALSLGLAMLAVTAVFVLALRFGQPISRALFSPSDEAVLLTTFGTVLLVGGVAQRLQVSAAVGAFLVGIALSGQVAERAGALLTPLRDLFAAVFFVFFGLQVNPAAIPPVATLAIVIGCVTAVTKLATGWWAARQIGVGTRGRLRAGSALIARGEFSIVIAGLGAGLDAQLRPLAAAYVLLMAILGPIAARVIEPAVMALRPRMRELALVSRVRTLLRTQPDDEPG